MPEATVNIGDFRCFPLSDGALIYPINAVFPGRSEADLAEALKPASVQPEIRVGYSGLLVDTGRQRILIDTGAGSLGPSTGALPEAVRRCGFTPEQIDIVVLSHLHPDHIGGLVTAEGRPRFSNAEILATRPEYDFWTLETNQARLKATTLFGLGEMEHAMLASIRTNILPLTYGGGLRLIENDCEPAPGVLVFPAFGHTPGHAGVLISSGRQQLLFGGDAIVHPAQVKHPEWNTVFEVDPEQAAITRRQMLDRVASDNCLACFYHFPFPCVGSVTRLNGGYRWEPVQP